MKHLTSWFQKESALSLAFLRIILLSYLLFFRLEDRLFLFEWSQSLPPEFMNQGVFLKLFPLPFPMTLDQQSLFFAVLTCSGYCALLGLLTRYGQFSCDFVSVNFRQSVTGQDLQDLYYSMKILFFRKASAMAKLA